MDTPHCTQVLMGLGQPFPFTIMPSSSNLYAFTSAWMGEQPSTRVSWNINEDKLTTKEVV